MIIGIDLGTTYSLCCYYKQNEPVLIPNSKGGLLTPSEVHLGKDNVFCVGNCDSQKYQYHFRFFKEFMGSTKTYEVNGEEITPVKLSAMILKQLKADAEAYLGEEVTEAVISVPAYFNDSQRIATKQAGQMAGLNTTRIVNEPSAAALAYQFGYDEATLMIFDFGGGTFDVSMVDCFDNIIEILSIAGDNHLGGKTIDEIMAKECCLALELNYLSLDNEVREGLLRDMEVVKEKLVYDSQLLYSFQGHSFLFTQEKLLQWSRGVFQKIKEIMARAVRDSGKELSDIDQVILVGGSSNLVGLHSFIKGLTGIDPIRSKNPQTVVALGMGYYAGMKSRDQALRDLILTDVCPFTLGVSVVSRPGEEAHVSPMISRNSSLPASKKQSFSTVTDFQSKICVEVVQGEGYFTRDNCLLVKMDFPIPMQPAGEEAVEVTFTYDLNGILQVDIYNQTSGTHQCRKVFSDAVKGLTEEEVEQAVEELNQFRLDYGSTETNLQLRRASALYGRMARHEKELLARLMGELDEALQQSRVEGRKQERKMEYFLDLMEEWEQQLFTEEHYPRFHPFLKANLSDDYDILEFLPLGEEEDSYGD